MNDEEIAQLEKKLREEKCKRKSAQQSERMRKLHADPEFNPLVCLTSQQRDEYDILRGKGGYSRDEALAIVADTATKAWRKSVEIDKNEGK